MEVLWQDVRFGLRSMLRNPGFTTVAVLTLALGIGATTAIFSVVYGVLFRPLPYPDADRVGLVYVHFQPQGVEHGTMSVADYLDWKAQNRAFQDIAIFSHSGGWRFDIVGSGEPEQVLGSYVTSGFFSVLEARPLLGRVFGPDENAATSPRAAVLSEALWRRHFGGNMNIVGQPIRLNGSQYTVAGVMPATFRFPQDTELWLNLRIRPPTRRGPFPYIGIGRLKPGVSFEQAQAETNAIGRRIEQEHPQNYSRLTLPVVPLRDDLVGQVRHALLVLFGGTGFVLLIAVVNVANMLLARATARQREVATRTALGASGGRIVTQMLTESSLLALVGGAAGLAVGYGAIQLLRFWNPGTLPRIEDVRLDGLVLTLTFLVSVATGVLFGFVPALQSSRTNLTASLREGGRSNTPGAARHRMQSILVVSEITLSLVLLIGAGLLLRSFVLLQQQKTGMQAPPRNVLKMQISPGGALYAVNDPKGIAFYNGLLARVRQIPGVESAAVSTALPPAQRGDWDTFEIGGQTWTEEGYPAVTNPQVSADYFSALGIPLLKGRYFTESDTTTAARVCVISQTMARRYFQDRDPLGNRLKQGGADVSVEDSPYMEIVGVVGDVKYLGLHAEAEGVFYQPFTQNFVTQRMFLIVRSAISAGSLAPTVTREIRAFDGNVVVNKVATMEETAADSVAEPRFRTLLLVVFAGVALFLAAIGIYGVIAFSVAQRTYEIGLRLAVGAQRSDVLRLIMGKVLRLTLVGLVLGTIASLAVTHILAGLLFGVQPTDPITFIGMLFLLSGVALCAAYAPARRAMAVDPLVALRAE